MTLKELKAKYDKQAINTIEKLCDESETKAMQQQKIKLGALFYLKKTGRFRENPEYKTCSFEMYLKARHKWTQITFSNLRWAHIKYPEETIKYGSDTLISIKTKCGPQKVPIVLKEIETVQSRRKNYLDRFQKQKIIDKHKRPQPKKKVKEKLTPKEFERECSALQKVNIDVRKEVSERREQVGKLKATVNNLKNENVKLKTSLQQKDKRIAQLEMENQRLIKRLREVNDFWDAKIIPMLPSNASDSEIAAGI